MRTDSADKKRWSLAAIIGGIDLFLNIASGSIINDADQAMHNGWWLWSTYPLWTNVVVLGTAIILIVYGPLVRLWDAVEQSIAGPSRPEVYSPPKPAMPMALIDQPKPSQKFTLGWKDPPPQRKPGQLGGPIDVVMLERRMVKLGKYVAKGIGIYEYEEPLTCPLCHGRGSKWGRYEGICEQCGGTGDLPGELAHYQECKPCSGKGIREGRYEEICPICYGLGRRVLDAELLKKVFQTAEALSRRPRAEKNGD